MRIGPLIFTAQMQYKNLHLKSAMVFKFTSNSNKIPPLLGIIESRELDLLLILEMSESVIYCYPVDENVGHTIRTDDLPKLLGDISEYVELKFRIPDKPPTNENPIISSGGLWVIKGDIPEEKHFGVGSMHLEKGRIHEAIEEFKKSVGYNAKYVRSLYSLGVCYSELNDYEKASNWFEKASKIDFNKDTEFNYVSLYFNKALSLKKLGKYDEAILDLKEVLKQDPKMSNAWTLKSNCHRAKREYEEAIKSLDKALEINPKNLLARRNKANILNIQGDEVKAQEILNKSLSIEPTDFQSWDIKGEQLMGSGNFEEALKCFNEAVKLSSGHPYDIQLRERCIQNQKQYKDIRKSLPQNSKGWNSRGVKLFSIGVYIEALGCFEEALRLKPDNYSFLLNKALTQKALARYRAALDGIEKLIRKKPNDASAWNDKGNIWFSLEQYDEAFNSFEKALEIDPNLTIAQNNKVEALKYLQLKGNTSDAKGNNQGAVDTYNQTSENDSQNQLARENYAREKRKLSMDKDLLALKKAFGDSLYNFLEKQGAAFTIKALEKRLEVFIEDLNERNYGRENLERTLNKLRADGRVNTAYNKGETHYFVKKKHPR